MVRRHEDRATARRSTREIGVAGQRVAADRTHGDVARVGELLTRSSIVTVVGAGGVGKTTLAREVARQMSPTFADGTAFVGLADLEDSALVPSEIARCLDLVDVSGAAATERLIAGLRSLRMLIVIDNFEHLIDAAPVLGAVAGECPDPAVLVTSRRRLGPSSERVLELAPLTR